MLDDCKVTLIILDVNNEFIKIAFTFVDQKTLFIEHRLNHYYVSFLIKDSIVFMESYRKKLQFN